MDFLSRMFAPADPAAAQAAAQKKVDDLKEQLRVAEEELSKIKPSSSSDGVQGGKKKDKKKRTRRVRK